MTDHPALQAALMYFQAGNFAAAKREIAKAVASMPAEPSHELEADAQRLRQAMASDPWARRLAIAAALLIAALAINYVG
ncbi:MAG: hypothetical protein SF187_23355 [Deltaproteobacteria bacterium]|nr:hypothetical protein [Deltaproteobacteria bacterium]